MVFKPDHEWPDDLSLPVQIARAQTQAFPRPSDPVVRYRAKWQLVRNLYGLGYNIGKLREVSRLIDWMMHLREGLSKRLEQ